MSYDFSSLNGKLLGVVDWLGQDLATVRSGRATPAVLDGVMVESYGSKTPLKHVGTISVEDPKTLRVVPWDKSLVGEIERGISLANLGLSSISDGAGIRVIFPNLTTERRQQLLKVVHEKIEKARISLRQERDEVWAEIQQKERDGTISEDEKFRAKEDLQKIVDSFNEKFDEAALRKEKELME